MIFQFYLELNLATSHKQKTPPKLFNTFKAYASYQCQLKEEEKRVLKIYHFQKPHAAKFSNCKR